MLMRASRPELTNGPERFLVVRPRQGPLKNPDRVVTRNFEERNQLLIRIARYKMSRLECQRHTATTHKGLA